MELLLWLCVQEPEKPLVTAPDMPPPECQRWFRCQIDAFNATVRGTLLKILPKGDKHAIAYFSKQIPPAEENYTANKREPSGSIYLLKWICWCFGGGYFNDLFKNQVLKNVFKENTINRHEACWLNFLRIFLITDFSFVKRRRPVLGYVLSRAP